MYELRMYELRMYELRMYELRKINVYILFFTLYMCIYIEWKVKNNVYITRFIILKS
jgi:hypothetical protein